MTPLVTVEAWQTYASEARAINAANGWGLTWAFEQVPVNIALIHSEITEAWTAFTIDECLAELADVVVRCVDLAELLDPGTIGTAISAASAHALANRDPLVLQLLQLHWLTSDLLESYRKVTDPVACRLRLRSGLAGLVAAACTVAAGQRLEQMAHFSGEQWADPAVIKPGQAVEAALWATLVKNRDRAYRHGGLRT